ncbi:MAG: rhodanese-like domain-containing protein [Candidatus Diapherotrites archaeon]|nr:rhodanese-like domain-containing protein [Candidatus Diapherotrites archaeon]
MSEISCEELNEKLKSKKKPFLLDVRTSEEYAKAHLEDSKLIPIQEFAERINELPADKTTEIVVYCHYGGRSTRVMQFMKTQGFTNVKSLEGGLSFWELRKLPMKCKL